MRLKEFIKFIFRYFPIHKGLLAAAENLPKVLEDRVRANEVKALPLPFAGSKVPKVASMDLEATRA